MSILVVFGNLRSKYFWVQSSVECSCQSHINSAPWMSWAVCRPKLILGGVLQLIVNPGWVEHSSQPKGVLCLHRAGGRRGKGLWPQWLAIPQSRWLCCRASSSSWRPTGLLWGMVTVYCRKCKYLKYHIQQISKGLRTTIKYSWGTETLCLATCFRH